MHNVSHDLLSGVPFHLSARSIREDLRERFDKVNSSRMYYLHKEIFTLTQGTSSVSAYYSKLKDLWDEYDSIIPAPPCDCEKSKKHLAHLQYQRLWQFLIGLNDGYSQARSQILMKSKAPSMNQAYAMILQDKSQRIIAGSHTVPIESMEPTTLFTSWNNTQKQRRNYNVECDFYHMKGHTREGCYKLRKCDYCNMKGHLKENCYKIIGYPADFKSKKKGASISGHLAKTEVQSVQQPTMPQPHVVTPDQYNKILQKINNKKSFFSESSAHMAGTSFPSVHMAGTSYYIPTKESSWIMDTGATNHMISNNQLLLNGIEIGSSGQVQMPTGETARITHVRDCDMPGGELLKDVLCVPNFKFNLLSVSKVTKDLNCCAVFYPDFFVFQELFSGRLKAIGRENDGLYVLKTRSRNDFHTHSKSMAVQNITDSEIWHKRLGHVPMLDKLGLLFKHILANLLNLFNCYIWMSWVLITLLLMMFGKHIKMVRYDNGAEFFNLLVDIYSIPMGLYTKGHVHTHLSKMEWSNESTDISLRQLGPSSSKKLRVIGCLGYASTLSKQDKFSPRAIKSVLLGYGVFQKGYKLYDLETHKAVDTCQLSTDDVTIHVHPDPVAPNSHDEAGHPAPVSPTSYDEASQPSTEATQPLHSSNNEATLPDSVPTSQSSSQEVVPAPPTELRKSNRTSKPPIWMKDFVIPDKFSAEVEPTTYAQAAKDPRWVEAMQLEIKALEDNNTSKVVPLPEGRKAIGCKWVYKIKYKATGEVERFKARLVAKGYSLHEGLDYEETLSLVVKMVTVRAVISIAAIKHWNIH
ncbi:uncharacterized protein LOC107819354 [Nicotiana tabacum]|uniref:Uncharacterized protein LOC107819354 n=1 Tax=Nicotiana tabacum TaxID=4097 RepID=A0AC58SIF2_TOBAC